MSQVEEFLEHFGVKGQRWGIRNYAKLSLGEKHRGPQGEKLSRKDKKWQKNFYKTNNIVTAHNALADRMNNGVLAKFNSQPKYKNVNAFDQSAPLTKQYFSEYNNLLAKHSVDILHSLHGFSPSGKLKVGLDTSDPNGHHSRIMYNVAQHANEQDDSELILEFNQDEQGRIISLRKIQTDIAQSSLEIGEDFLEHFGIKGMHWGIRNTRFSRSKQQHRKTSQDYRKARQLKKRGPASLSNKQLEEVNKRLNLEKNYKNLNPNALERIKKEKKTVEAILSVTAGVTSVAALAQTDRGKKAISIGKSILDKVLSNLGNWYNMRGPKEVGTLFDARKF